MSTKNSDTPNTAAKPVDERAVYEKPQVTELGDWQNVTELDTGSIKSPFWDLFKGS